MENLMPKNLNRAKFIKEERRARAWPQTQLAEIAGVNSRTIQRLEKDGAGSFETLMGVANAFGIDVRELTEKPKNKKENKVHHLKHVSSGKEFYEIIKNADQFQIEHDESHDPRALGAMKGIIEMMKGDIVRMYDADPVKRIDIEAEMTDEILGLQEYGFYIFGIKRTISKINGSQKTNIVLSTIYMSHSDSPKIIKDKNLNMMIPALLSEVAY